MSRDAEVRHPLRDVPFVRLWAQNMSTATLQTLFLFAVDGLSNAIDYGFHVYLGRKLAPEGFAIVQTVNAVLLVVITAAGVLQPVVARQVAEGEAGDTSEAIAGSIFQHYFRLAGALGLILAVLLWLGRITVASWLNVPAPAVALAAVMVLLSLLRPVLAGMLQGGQRFVAFGATRLAYSGGRFALSLILLGVLGGGTLAAVALLPLGAIVALVAGLALLGIAVWRPAAPLSKKHRREGWGLSVSALLAYAAYMTLLSQDLIWVNRAFAADTAGSYATAVLLRRVLLLLPGAVIVVLYPRVVRAAASGKQLDRILVKAGLAVVVPTLFLIALYFSAGDLIIRFTFGAQYLMAAPLLGWLGLATLGYGVVSIWMNTYLATRPWPFVLLMVGTVVVQLFLFAYYQTSLSAILIIFASSGWFLALCGGLLYFVWLRPRLT